MVKGPRLHLLSVLTGPSNLENSGRASKDGAGSRLEQAFLTSRDSWSEASDTVKIELSKMALPRTWRASQGHLAGLQRT